MGRADGDPTVRRVLARGLHRFCCPTPLAIAELDCGHLEPDQWFEVAQHVAMCPRCQEEVQTLRSFLAGAPIPEASPT